MELSISVILATSGFLEQCSASLNTEGIKQDSLVIASLIKGDSPEMLPDMAFS